MRNDEFRSFEAAGWEQVAEGYASSDVVTGLTRQAARSLVKAVDARPGMRVLDLACGPGYAAVEAQRLGAQVVVADIAEAMVAVAARNATAAEFHVAPAEALPLAADDVDGVVCGFGLPHFGDPEAVFAETFRVTRSGGRVGFTTWCAPDRVPFFGIVFTAVAEHGSFDVPLPDGPDMFRFADEAEARAALDTAGFSDVSVEVLPLTATVTRGSEAMDLATCATVRTRALYEGQTPEARAAIADHVTAAVEDLRDGADAITVDMPAVLITATVP